MEKINWEIFLRDNADKSGKVKLGIAIKAGIMAVDEKAHTYLDGRHDGKTYIRTKIKYMSFVEIIKLVFTREI